MKLEYTLINGNEQGGLDESLYLFVGPKINEIGSTIEGDSDNGTSFYCGYGNLNIPNSITSIGNYAFYCCTGFTSVTIPNSVTSIGECAFSGCRGLTSVNIPNSVTVIDEGAFTYCSSLTNVTIGNSVTSIGNSAFYGCSELTSITCLATTPPEIGSDVFEDTNSCPIYVPADSVNAYKSASGWSTYASRIQAITN